MSVTLRSALLAAVCLLPEFVLAAGSGAEAPAVPGWHSLPGGRWMPCEPTGSGRAGFTRMLPHQTGVTFTNLLADRSAAINRTLEIGSGVALGDVDGDGLCDLYLCGLEAGNRLFRNRGGWVFEDITEQAGVRCPGQASTGAVLADLDGDEDLDLLVNGIGVGTRSFLNDGRGRFTEVTDTRLVRRFGSTSLALADVDGDGDLDLYVANYRAENILDDVTGFRPQARREGGRIVIQPEERFLALAAVEGAVHVLEKGEVDFLYLNDGRGRFAPVSWTQGAFLDEEGRPLAEAPVDWGLSVMFHDANGDGLPDLYTTADFFYWPDRLWLNVEGKAFRAADRFAARHMSLSGMSVDFADVDRDGRDDFLVTEMVSRRHASRHWQRPNMMLGLVDQPVEQPEFRPEVAHNTLFWNRGDGTYAEVAFQAGVPWSEWTWSGVFLDVDLDGYEDLLIGNGNNHDVQDADIVQALRRLREVPSVENNLRHLREFARLELPKLAFRNLGGLEFKEVGQDWGFSEPAVSHGMALGDLDGDGDLDVVINNLNREPFLMRNNVVAPRLAVRLRGKTPNTAGVGARITVRGGPVVQSAEMRSGGRYLSGDEARRVFAAGATNSLLDVEVRWRSGRVSALRGVPANSVCELIEPENAPVPQPATPTPAPWFEDASVSLGHTQVDTPFNDFAVQPLLPRKLSSLGPGVAWFDFDGDGRDDLVLPAGQGGRLGLFQNQGAGGFSRIQTDSAPAASLRDQNAVLGLADTNPAPALLLSQGSYEETSTAGSALAWLDAASLAGEVLLPPGSGMAGPLALGDVDADGDLDLFVGGRLAPGRYPESPVSRLLMNRSGSFVTTGPPSAVLQGLGMVSDAVWTDLDGDGRPELALATDWGPVRVLHFDAQGITDLTEALGLGRYPGWWNGITAGDFDGDGRMDLAVSNWGRNHKYALFVAETLHLYYGPWNGDGRIQLLEAYQDPESGETVPWRAWDAVSRTLPWVAEIAPGYRAFGSASIRSLLAGRPGPTGDLLATYLDSMVFLNRGRSFEPRPLPAEAQFAPAFGIAVADADGDGAEDLFLAQNFFGNEPETARMDAGRGLWLRGDGKGGFRAMPGQESGVRIHGEQRGCAIADYDADGRPDLVVVQRNRETKLFRNLKAAPGLRVRFDAGARNPAGIGVRCCLVSSRGPGPMRELHAGGGYWSQDSAVQVLALPARSGDEPVQVRVHWPGGRSVLLDLPQGAKEVRVRFPDIVELLR